MKTFRLHDIATRDPETKLVNVVIDTPKGSHNKYRYDEKLGLFRLSRVLPAGMHFPYDFGSIPRTRAEDGDALDVLVLMDAATFAGCLVSTRLVGVLRATQTEKRTTIQNDRLIAVAETPVNRPAIHRIDEFGNDRLSEIEQFFVSYNRVHDRVFTPTGKVGPKAAENLLRKAMHAFTKAAAR